MRALSRHQQLRKNAASRDFPYQSLIGAPTTRDRSTCLRVRRIAPIKCDTIGQSCTVGAESLMWMGVVRAACVRASHSGRFSWPSHQANASCVPPSTPAATEPNKSRARDLPRRVGGRRLCRVLALGRTRHPRQCRAVRRARRCLRPSPQRAVLGGGAGTPMRCLPLAAPTAMSGWHRENGRSTMRTTVRRGVRRKHHRRRETRTRHRRHQHQPMRRGLYSGTLTSTLHQRGRGGGR